MNVVKIAEDISTELLDASIKNGTGILLINADSAFKMRIRRSAERVGREMRIITLNESEAMAVFSDEQESQQNRFDLIENIVDHLTPDHRQLRKRVGELEEKAAEYERNLTELAQYVALLAEQHERQAKNVNAIADKIEEFQNAIAKIMGEAPNKALAFLKQFAAKITR